MEVFASWTDWASAQRALAPRLPASTVADLAQAYAIAEEYHGDQTRPAGEPYVHHLLEALEIAVDSGTTDPDAVLRYVRTRADANAKPATVDRYIRLAKLAS